MTYDPSQYQIDGIAGFPQGMPMQNPSTSLNTYTSIANTKPIAAQQSYDLSSQVNASALQDYRSQNGMTTPPIDFQRANIPLAPVDQMTSIPSMQNVPQLQQIQPQQVQSQPPNVNNMLNQILSQYTSDKQAQNTGTGLIQQILGNRIQPTMQDVAQSINNTASSFGAPDQFKAEDPNQAMASRIESQLAPYTAALNNQMRAGTQYMNMSGGGTGVLINRLMSENPGMSFQDALFRVQSGFKQGMQLDANGNVIAMPGITGVKTDLAHADTLGKQNAIAETSKTIEQQKKTGENIAENQQNAVSTGDITGLYGKLIQDAKTAPSGVVQNTIARAANAANIPTQGSVAQATFDADLNNLYLATIRSLKGTGRVMEQELNKIAEAAPKATDSEQVKIAKAQAHMAYYNQRMQELGFDPSTGQPASTSPANVTGVATMPAAGAATHRYNPQTGQLEVVQ